MAYQIVAAVIIIGNVEPFQSNNKSRSEIFNEVTLMVIMYSIICFSPLVPDVEVRFQLGYICIIAISLHFLVNFIQILVQSFSTIRMNFIKKYAKRQYKKQRIKHKRRIKQEEPMRLDFDRRRNWLSLQEFKERIITQELPYKYTW